MSVLSFIFGLGIAFSIFSFIWGVIMFFLSFFRGNTSKNNQVMDYVLRILKYGLLVSVTANYIIQYQSPEGSDGIGWANMLLGVFVLGLYLMGKLQRRTVTSMLLRNPAFSRFTASIDLKVERYILSGSLVFFVLCLQYPPLVENGVVNWFTQSIVDIYDTPFIGWIFSIIAFFFLVNIIYRGANVIGNLLSGRPINPPGNGFNGAFGSSPNTANPFEQFRQKQREDEGFVDYEDVTDQEDA